MKKKAFTLIEMIVVVVIMSIIAGFALASYDRARQKNVERNYAAQLTALAGVSNQYKARNRGYWDVGGSAQNEASIETTLGTLIASEIDDATVTYNSTGPDNFAFYAASGRYGFTARVDIRNEPCCHSGTCRYLPACSCPVGLDYRTCNNMCIHDATDRDNCGSCNVVCAAGGECVSGSCV